MDVYTIIIFVFLTLNRPRKGYLKNLLFEWTIYFGDS